MLFTADAWPGLADGSITLTFRRWTRPQAKAGGRYRVAGMLLEATAVQQVTVREITDDDAVRAGEVDRTALLARLRQPADDDLVWRVELRYLGRDDRAVRRERADPAPEELAEICRRLARLDRDRPWTARTLRLIERYPGIVSTALARHAGQERARFKLDVRKLKEIGLTESLDVGYRLSPLGEAVLRSLDPS